MRLRPAVASFFIAIALCFNHSDLKAQANGASTHFLPLPAFYSGSFDPPTVGHLRIIREIANSGVGKLHILVNRSGAKDFNASAAQRIAMLHIALADLGDRIQFHAVNAEDKDAVIGSLGRAEGTSAYYNFAGEDSFEKVGESALHDPHRRWVMIERENNPHILARARSLGAELMHIPDIDNVSSTRLREDLARGNFNSPLLDPSIRSYLQRSRMYQNLSPAELAARELQHRKAYADFVARAQTNLADTDLRDIPPPPFKATQSPEAWAEKFENWLVEQAHVAEPKIHAFRDYVSLRVFASKRCIEGYRSLNSAVH